jgi:hypothetical protein
VHALRLDWVTTKLRTPAPSFSAALDDLRNGFHTEIATASEVLRAEISLLKSACLASISGVFGAFQHSFSSIFSKDFSAFWGFPLIFEDFKEQKFTLLWRGSRDGFKARQFHCR